MPRGKANNKANKATTATAKRSNTSSRTAGSGGSSAAAGMSKGGNTGRRTNLAAINKQFRELPQQQQHKFLISSLGTVLTSTGSGNKSSAAMS